MKEKRKQKFDLLKEFFESEKSSGYVLVFLTIVSLLIANIFVGNDYVKFWHKYLDLSFSSIQLKLSIEHWINDGLMVIFFLLVGLEIEREIYIGELSSIKKSALPAIAALGGMMIPALIHFAFNANTATQSGFGIPMATDIAFTLGVLSLLGSKIPISLKIFLTALAIIDDLGAILIIAFFYTSDLSFAYLIGSLSVFALLLIFNRMKINKLSIYLLLGLVMWYLMLKSGVHATIAGVLLAFAIPFNKNDDENISYKLQHYLHKPVAFLVLPIFALANTAIIIPTNIIESITTNNSLGIFFGLSFGKLIGIFSFSFIAVKIGFGVLPKDLNWKLIAGAASLAGIGFTMSIFITNLAFSDVEIINASKLIIIIASVVSAISGLTILNLAAKK